MDTMTTAAVKPSPEKEQTTERSPKALKTRAEGLVDLATQSLKQVLERQTGNRVSRTDEATIKLAVRSIIKATVATIHYHEASS
jgi:hypothetical protein